MFAILHALGSDRRRNPTIDRAACRRGDRLDLTMSAIGPKRTSATAPHMSAIGGKADMTLCGNPLSRSLLGVKRTWLLQRICLLLTQSGHWARLSLAVDQRPFSE